ncbi:tRNA dihydrouridine synthase DusB [Actinotalea sp. JY-7885]|uniref:tRNA dihydrouridine synthase DusB n=1 Tax=Actinotalea sp. JY-7885 TaxID=2758576 RepID=UPI00281529B2|nr:tRNA dihydrouridine synthase DusB [Actinotalea sp. JY-7885]
MPSGSATPGPPSGAVPGVRPLRIGPITVDVPVVLAPMAGVTNRAFRRLCREHGAGLYVAEMVTSRALVERTPESLRIIRHDPDERPRSVQVYGVEPTTVGAAVRMLVEEDRADHVDLNFGCPVPKVTRRGGGAVLPWKRDLFAAIVRAAVGAAAPHGVPVTVKMRKGIDEDHLTYLEAGLTAQDAGVAAVALHARTAADYYSGTADWSAIARLKEAVTDIPVLGNGDIWSAEDALTMMRETGCDGVVVGRGCQGRPWLFADLAAAMRGSDVRVRPGLREVAGVVRRHAELMVEEFGDESKALRELRKHMAWYLKGYAVGGPLRAELALVESLAHLDELLGRLDLDQPYPGVGAEGQRGRAGSPKRPHLPEGWLDSRDLSDAFRRSLQEAELSVSGG